MRLLIAGSLVRAQQSELLGEAVIDSLLVTQEGMGRRLTEGRKKYSTWIVSEARRKLKLRAVEYKGGACCRCGYSKCVAALQFHHVDPDGKDFQIGGKVLCWEKIQAELDKTIMVCANCHHELHHEAAEARRAAQETEVRSLVPVRVPAPHGSASRYSMGCRCEPCRAAHATRLREYKRERRRRAA